VNDHDATVYPLIKELPAVPRPDGKPARSGRDLPLASRGASRIGPHINVYVSGLGGCIGQPPAVGREGWIDIGMRRTQKQLRLARLRMLGIRDVERQDPDVLDGALAELVKREPPAIGRE